MIRPRYLFIALLLAGLADGTLSYAGPFSFTGVGDLAGGVVESHVREASGDGSVVVGWSSSASGTQAFRWTRALGIEGIGDLAGGLFNSQALGISANGQVIVGQGSSLNGTEAFRWSNGSFTPLGFIPGGTFSSAASASFDGSVIVGLGSALSGFEAFRWTAATNAVGLGQLPGGVSGDGWGISGDGSIVVGVQVDQLKGFKWTGATGPVALDVVPGGPIVSRALDVSTDGRVVIGDAKFTSTLAVSEPFRWEIGGSMVPLTPPSGDFLAGTAFGVSGNGRVVVGNAGNQAFLWTAETKLINLKSFLIANGVEGLDNWTLIEARGVSDDGRTIVGEGVNPLGQTEAWVATIPEPGSLTLAVAGALALLAVVYRTHRGRR